MPPPGSDCRSCRVVKFQPYLILVARSLILLLMLPPKVWKASTAANATSAAATAYSESSRPVSSRRNFLIILLLLLISVRRCYLDEPANMTLTVEGSTPRGLVV